MNQKAVVLFSTLFLFAALSCGKDGGKGQTDALGEGPVKYARYGISVYKEQELKTWAANLSKTEPVTLLETVKIPIQKKETEVAKVKLSDGNIFFLKMSHLADKPVVFVEDTKVYVRNNASSRVYAVVPKGTIAFVIKEMGEWTQVYVGKIDGKWVSKQWANGGYSSEDMKIQEAKNFEEASAVLKSSKSKPDQISQALAVMKELSSSGMFSDAANALITAHSEEGSISSEENADENNLSGDTAKVETAAGLTMREEPGVSSKSIVVIPSGSIVNILNKGDIEETISGKTSVWYKVEWSGNKGWVFGGFLSF